MKQVVKGRLMELRRWFQWKLGYLVFGLLLVIPCLIIGVPFLLGPRTYEGFYYDQPDRGFQPCGSEERWQVVGHQIGLATAVDSFRGNSVPGTYTGDKVFVKWSGDVGPMKEFAEDGQRYARKFTMTRVFEIHAPETDDCQ